MSDVGWNAANDPSDPFGWKIIAAEQAAAAAATAAAPTTPVPAQGAAADAATVAARVKEQNTATFNQLAGLLNDAGLGRLFFLDSQTGKPAGWLWEKIVDGTVDSQASLMLAIEQTEPFKQRYPAIAALRAKSAAGEAVYVPSVAEVKEYEVTVKNAMMQAGLPGWFYDDPVTDLQGLMTKGLSAVTIEKRLGQTWERVKNTDPAVRAAFTQFYGVAQGDAALAAWYLDPDKTDSTIEKASRAAYTAGYGATMGINIDQIMAEKIAMSPKTEGGILEGLGQVTDMESVFVEGITETQDLTTDTGLEAVFGESGAAKASIEKRILERQANARATVGGALTSNAGVTGLGSS